MNERDELTALSIKLFRRLGDECDDSPTPNYEEDNYDAGYLAGLSRAQEIIRAEFPTIASGYRKVGADTDTHTQWGNRHSVSDVVAQSYVITAPSEETARSREDECGWPLVKRDLIDTGWREVAQ